MTEFIVAAVLWGVLGLVSTGALWALTVWTSGILALSAMDRKVPAWAPVLSMITGIIVTIGWFVLVVVNVVTNIVNAVNAGG